MRVRPAGHDTEWTGIVVRQVSYHMLCIFCGGHKLWKWQWCHAAVCTFALWFFPRDNAVQICMLIMNLIIQFCKASALPAVSGWRKAQRRTYRMALVGYGIPAARKS